MAVVAKKDAPHPQPALDDLCAPVDSQATKRTATEATTNVFLDSVFMSGIGYASIVRISSDEGTLPLTLTTPSTTSAGVVMTPNVMIR